MRLTFLLIIIILVCSCAETSSEKDYSLDDLDSMRKDIDNFNQEEQTYSYNEIEQCDEIIKDIEFIRPIDLRKTCGNGIYEEYELLRTCPEDCQDLPLKEYGLCIDLCYSRKDVVRIFSTENELDFGPELGSDFKELDHCGRNGTTICECNRCYYFYDVNQPLFEIKYEGSNRQVDVCRDIVTKYMIDGVEYKYEDERVIEEEDLDKGFAIWQHYLAHPPWENDTACHDYFLLGETRYLYFPNNLTWIPTNNLGFGLNNVHLIRDRDECYLDVALEYNDSRLCRDMILDSYNDECYYTFALIKDEQDLCNYIRGYERDSCLEKFFQKRAIIEKNHTLCYEPYGVEEDGFPKERNDEIVECVFQIAVNLTNHTICYDLEGFRDYDERCISAVAVAKNDPTICNDSLIWDKSDCLSGFGEK